VLNILDGRGLLRRRRSDSRCGRQNQLETWKEDTISIDRAVATAANPTKVLRGDKESKGGLPHDQLFVITGESHRQTMQRGLLLEPTMSSKTPEEAKS
jgi:hypothetical protein